MSESSLRELFDQHDLSSEPPFPAGYLETTVAGGRRRVRRRRVVRSVATGGVAAVAALAVAGGFTLSDGAGTASRPGGHHVVARQPTTASALLGRISLAANEKTVTVRPDQFIYVKTRITTTGKSGGRTRTIDGTSQSWTSADGSRPGRNIEPDKLGHMNTGPVAANPSPSIDSPTYEYLKTLPTDPDKLLTRIRASARDRVNLKPGQQDRLDVLSFETIAGMIRNQLLPPKLAAALYTDLARIHGVTLDSDAVDAAGRHGIAVALTDPVAKIRMELIFDKKTYAFLGERHDNLDTGRPQMLSAELSKGAVDRIGQTPH